MHSTRVPTDMRSAFLDGRGRSNHSRSLGTVVGRLTLSGGGGQN